MNEPSVSGDWQKISVLGSGAFGVVTLWKNNKTEDFVAIKKCKFQSHTSLSLRQKERWFNEVQIMKNIHHANIIAFKPLPVEFEEDLLKFNPSKMPLLSMEYCTKGNLRHVLRDPKNLSGVEETEVRVILEDIANGLEYLHSKNITHRDVKPDNIVLQHCNDRLGKTVYKIIDLGYAKELKDTVLSFVGTLNYLAPEIFTNDNYNFSVDYWSLGVLGFEIVCGTLPFLPNLTPVERFEKLRDKGPDDICIYMSYSGSIAYSTEIKKEHHISNWLKEKLEFWFRHVFQFDPNKRTEAIPNSTTNVFQYLRDTFSKTIVNVFSIPKLEFYSYEINESTLVETMKDWISRDIKVPKNELTLIFEKQDAFVDENSLVVDFMGNSCDIFVIRQNLLISDTVPYNFPKLLKEIFNVKAKFNMKFITQLFAQSLFYITEENKMLNYFKRSFDLYFNYIQSTCDRADKICAIMKKSFAKLLTKVECYNNIKRNNTCDIDLSKNKEYKDCLGYSQRLVSSLERCIENRQSLICKINVLNRRKHILGTLIDDIKKNLQETNVQPQFAKVVGLLEKGPKEKEQFLLSLKHIISDTIKIKNTLFSSKKLLAYLKACGLVLTSASDLLSWTEDFNKHIADLSTAFEQNEVTYRNVVIKAAEHKSEEKSPEVTNGVVAKELLELPVIYLMQENKELRCIIEDVLSSSIYEHKKGTEQLNKINNY